MPIIAVVIPCRNEQEHIRACIESVLQSKIDNDCKLQIIVIDGGSTDQTIEIIKKLSNEHSNIILLHNSHAFTPISFNMGITHASEADYIQIVGARHLISFDYISKALSILQVHPDIWCVGGRIYNDFLNSTSEIIAKSMGSAFGMGIGNFRTLQKSGFTDTVTSPLYPIRVFKTIGLFDAQLVRNQDDDFNYRIKLAGGKIYYEHSISLRYFVRASFKNVFKQFYQYGYWKVFVNKKHQAVTTWRQLVPPFFLLYLLSLPVMAFLSSYSLLYSIPFMLYCTLNIISSCSEFPHLKKIILTCYAYLILHVSYGMGYLHGVLRFIILGKRPEKSQTQLTR